jgi:colanic acid/amylovoran biosynthesis glycosyltransferase
MKIAYAVSQFPKLSETFILRELLELSARGHELLVLSIKRDTETLAHPESDALRERTLYPGFGPAALGALAAALATRPLALAGVTLRLVAAHAGHPIMMFKSLALVPLALLFARRLRAAGVQHLHAHWASYPATLAWIIHRMTGLPYSVTGHAHDLYLPNPMLPRKVRESKFFATISEFNRALLIQTCGPGALDKVRLVRCGLPLEEFPLRTAPRRAEGGLPTLLSIGRLVDYKGFDVLVRACARLRDDGSPVACVVVGEGPERPALERLVRTLRLDDLVRFEGALRQDEVRARLREADLFVLACVRGRDGQQDGIPIVLMEAMALGVPVISTNLSGIPELVVDRQTGLLAAPGDDAHLAAVIRRLLEDPMLAGTLAAGGRARVEKEFDVRRSVSVLCREFERTSPPRGAA